MLIENYSWDAYYQNDIDHDKEDDDEGADLADPSQLESWFDDVGAPTKVLNYLTSDKFPLSAQKATCSVLDLGTGNGSALFSLFIDGGYSGSLVGVDYSEQSIQLAEKLKSRYDRIFATQQHKTAAIAFEIFDLITSNPTEASWWPADAKGFDLVLDKGTFDAISLSSERIHDGNGTETRLHELYPKRTATLVKPGGFFLITTCNWTEDEIISWFTSGDMRKTFEVFHKIKYKSFSFGGHQGQGVSTVCFRKIN